MSKKIQIQGISRFQNIGMGFWGIETKSGKQYRPVNMPNQLKLEGAEVSCEGVAIEEDMNIFMWGTPIKIVSFETLMPG